MYSNKPGEGTVERNSDITELQECLATTSISEPSTSNHAQDILQPNYIRHPHDKVKEAEQNLKLVRIQKIIDEISKIPSMSDNQDIVAFVGPTKAGKSTLINCLMGNRLKCIRNKDTEDVYVDSIDPLAGPVIGTGAESETLLPQGYSYVRGTNWTMCDFPGLGDNKGTEQEIANAAAFERALRPQRSVRFVLVVPIDLLTSSDPMPFFKLLADISSICPNISQSLCLIATKSQNKTTLGALKKVLSAEFRTCNENSKIVLHGKRIIQQLIDLKHYGDFKAPVMDDDSMEENFQIPNADQICDVIKELKETTVEEVPMVISKDAKLDILELYTMFYKIVKCAVAEACTDLDFFVQQKIDEIQNLTHDDKSAASFQKLALFCKGKEAIIKVKNRSRNFTNFFAQMRDIGLTLGSLADNVEKFVFIEKIKNMYNIEKGLNGHGEQEFFYMIFQQLTSSAQRYSDLIKSSEAATEEEKRLELEWQMGAHREQEKLRKELERLERENEAVLVKAAKYISSHITTPIYNWFYSPLREETVDRLLDPLAFTKLMK